MLKENVFYQDNQSTIRFERNGRKSCGPNSRHIDIRYFFIKDRLGIENIDVQYCPTEEMLADFFTKPLQGNLFRKLKEVIMGHAHINSLKEIASAPSQERVGENEDTENWGDRANVQKTDGILREPTIADKLRKTSNEEASYADVVKRQGWRRIVSFESARSEILSPLTLKK